MKKMEEKYSILRKHLNELGYHQTLSYDSVPLVEQLLGDLVKTTESLFQYKNVAQAAIEERDQLQLGAEPYKCDNAKLVQECNDLHLTFIQFKEQTDKLQRDLKTQIEKLEKENEELNITVDRLKRTSDKTSSGYSTRRTTIPSKSSLKHSATSLDTKSSKSAPKDKHICTSSEKMTSRDNEIQCLRKENCRLKSELFQQIHFAENLTDQLDTRDEEIQRLTGLLEGGRPIEALNADCCFKEISAKLAKISEENNQLKCAQENLELQLAEAIRKQHEAMKRALMLADRNKELERELHDIDQMALAVEAECNCKVKLHMEKVNEAQMELNMAREEKDNLHRILDSAMEDKRRMTDRMNHFQKIEHDLNHEIDKLAQQCTCQKRKIADLEGQLKDNQRNTVKSLFADKRGGDNYPSEYGKSGKSQSPSGKQSRGSSPGKKSRSPSPPTTQKSRDKSPKSSKEKKTKKGSVDSSAKNKDIQNDKSFIEKLTKERNEFQNKCKALQEQLEKLNSSSQKGPRPSSPTKIQQGGDTLKRNIKEKEDKISKLEKNIQNLTREKHELITKLDEMKKWGNDNTLKAHSKAEKERDMARGDCKRIEEERDALRQRLKQVTETHKLEMDTLKHLVTETERKLNELENERRELVNVQGTRRATINSLEEKVEMLSSQLRTTQSELEHVKTMHSQLKVLHEQTDRALADAQAQLNQVEGEYAKATNTIRDMDMKCECSQNKQALAMLKSKLSSIDAERDNLLIEIDDKTERIATLEMELQSRNNKTMNLERMVQELQQKLSSYTDELSSKEYLLKNNSAEVNTIRRSLDDALKDKSSALKENKRLQEDVAKVSYECRCVNGELDRAKREIDDLKTQLQQYVFEIKRAEDLISKKEIERSEMLDQFRNLSEETTVLESNNHTLESQAIEVRNQLSTATNHIHDLESTLEQLTTLNKDYEKQINQMTKQIASLETQVRQSGSINRNVESEMSDMKCLCVKLDEQKEALKKEVKHREDYSHQLEIEKEQLKKEMNKLKDALHKEQANIGSLENLLAACRQETVEQRLLNQELQSEIHRLKNLVQELQNKLRRTSKEIQNTDEECCTPKTCPKLNAPIQNTDEECCTPKTCPKLNSRPQAQAQIPEKTILDEVCLHKTLYCSGTQQNLQTQPEQRNVAIQQIFRSQTKYVERTDRTDADDDDVITETSLNRFYLPKTPPRCRFTEDPVTKKITCTDNTDNNTTNKPSLNLNNTTKSRVCCTDRPFTPEEQEKRKQQNDVLQKCPYTTRESIVEKNRPSVIADPQKRKQKSDVLRKSAYSAREPIIEEKEVVKTVRLKSPVNIRPQSSPASASPRRSPTGATGLVRSDKPKQPSKQFQQPKEKEKEKEKEKSIPLGTMRNSAFWREGPSEPEAPEQTLKSQNVPHSEPAIRRPTKKVQKFHSYQNEMPMKPINALDHDTFHNITPQVIIKPSADTLLTAEEEIALRKSRRKTQALTLQKMCTLRKTLNLDDSRTKLIYRTEMSSSSSPFQSKSSSIPRDYEISSLNTSRQYTNNTSDIMVTPEICKHNIVDSPKSVTFSYTTRCQTIDDIDAKCKQLLKANLTNSNLTNV